MILLLLKVSQQRDFCNEKADFRLLKANYSTFEQKKPSSISKIILSSKQINYKNLQLH